MKKPRMHTEPLAKGDEKALEIFEFSGICDSMRKNGMLLDCENVHVLSGGALASLLAAKKIDSAQTPLPSIAGVYTYYRKYDPSYEIPTTAEWVYEHICPKDVLNYPESMTAASRLLIADVGCPAKTEEGYRKVYSAFSDGVRAYVLYEAVYNIIDQRRVDQLDVLGDAYTVVFDSTTNEEDGTFAKICTLTQVFLDVIEADGAVSTMLFTAALTVQKTLGKPYEKSRLISFDGENYRYVSTDYLPSIGAGYAAHFDRVYTDIYPKLASAYKVRLSVPMEAKRLVRYRNRIVSAAPYGATGEKLLLLPDMRLMTETDGKWHMEKPSTTIPRMDAAVQHFERLFGIAGDRVYASAAGDCTSYAEAVDNLPATAGWQTVTADAGGFTAIASFDGKAIIFTAQSMMTVRGTELPFSTSFVGSFGCNNPDSLAVCGDWLYFIGKDGIRRYNGSRVESIGDALPRDLSYADATLTSMNGLVVVHLEKLGGLYIFDPASEAWSHLGGDKTVSRLVGGTNAVLFHQNGGIVPYVLFGEAGEFSFSLALRDGGRRRIRSISVTAHLAPEARLSMYDAYGRELLCIEDACGETVTRRCLVRGMYQDGGALHFAGSGDVTLYGIRITYAPLRNAARQMR